MTQQNIGHHLQQLYKCNICEVSPRKPVLSKCGHLFCWPCLHRELTNSKKCFVCGSQCYPNQCYPIFIERDEEQSENQQMQSRPDPVHRQKILNPSAGTGSVPFGINNLPNNISRKKLIAGSSLPPSMFIQTFNNIEDSRPGDSDEEINKKCKIVTYIFCLLTIICVGVLFFM